MLLRDKPIQRKLMTAILLTSGTVALLTCAAYFIYEFYSFRQSALQQLSTLGEIIASNSTAALAFDDKGNADETLAALSAEHNIEAAALYDESGRLFSFYPPSLAAPVLPTAPGRKGFYFAESYLEGFQPVEQGSMRLGTLYLRSNMQAMYERFRLYGGITILVIIVSLLVAYLLSRSLQKRISEPILALAETAKAISDQRNYSVRAVRLEDDELGLLTDAFNHMLTQIEAQNREIRSFNQKLEQKVTERTYELQLANSELEAFSYTVSHDLRAPLRHITIYMNMLLQRQTENMDVESRKMMEAIANNARKMNELIEDLLTFSQLGKKELSKTMVSMNDMVRTIWEELKKTEEDRFFDFKLNTLPDACVDRVTMRQVWVNFISNAIKYTRNKKKAVIEIYGYEENGSLVFTIRDNGAGFDMKYYNKLFGVFQRLHSTAEFEGTGVGLAIVERIIARHGGKVWAESKPDEGATFYFSIPKAIG